MLTKEVLSGKQILIEINLDPSIQRHFGIIYAAGKMQYRYIKKKVSKEEATEFLDAFKEAYRWIKNKYCQ
jgi:hypothetical protein